MTPYQKCRQQRNELLKALRELSEGGALTGYIGEAISALNAKQNARFILKTIEEQTCTT